MRKLLIKVTDLLYKSYALSFVESAKSRGLRDNVGYVGG